MSETRLPGSRTQSLTHRPAAPAPSRRGQEQCAASVGTEGGNGAGGAGSLADL